MKSKKVFWGIVILLAAAAMIVLAVFPGIALIGVPIWKIVLAVLLVYWLIDNLIFGDSLREHFSIFLQLGLLAVLFRSEIAALVGANTEDNFLHPGLVMGGAVLLTIAVALIFDGKSIVKTSHTAPAPQQSYGNSFGSKVNYLDFAAHTSFTVSNSFGETVVYCQNVDAADPTVPIYINVSNKFGETEIHVPADVTVSNEVRCSLGGVNARPNQSDGGRMLIVNGSNAFGEVQIVSP